MKYLPNTQNINETAIQPGPNKTRCSQAVSDRTVRALLGLLIDLLSSCKKKKQEGKKKAHHYVAKCASTSVHTSGSLFICEKKGDGGVYPWFLLSTAVLQLLEVSKDQSRRRC